MYHAVSVTFVKWVTVSIETSATCTSNAITLDTRLSRPSPRPVWCWLHSDSARLDGQGHLSLFWRLVPAQRMDFGSHISFREPSGGASQGMLIPAFLMMTE